MGFAGVPGQGRSPEPGREMMRRPRSLDGVSTTRWITAARAMVTVRATGPWKRRRGVQFGVDLVELPKELEVTGTQYVTVAWPPREVPDLGRLGPWPPHAAGQQAQSLWTPLGDPDDGEAVEDRARPLEELPPPQPQRPMMLARPPPGQLLGDDGPRQVAGRRFGRQPSSLPVRREHPTGGVAQNSGSPQPG